MHVTLICALTLLLPPACYVLAKTAVSFPYGNWQGKLALLSVVALMFLAITLQSELNFRFARPLRPDAMLGLMSLDSVVCGVVTFYVLYKAKWQ